MKAVILIIAFVAATDASNARKMQRGTRKHNLDVVQTANDVPGLVKENVSEAATVIAEDGLQETPSSFIETKLSEAQANDVTTTANFASTSQEGKKVVDTAEHEEFTPKATTDEPITDSSHENKGNALMIATNIVKTRNTAKPFDPNVQINNVRDTFDAAIIGANNYDSDYYNFLKYANRLKMRSSLESQFEPLKSTGFKGDWLLYLDYVPLYGSFDDPFFDPLVDSDYDSFI